MLVFWYALVHAGIHIVEIMNCQIPTTELDLVCWDKRLAIVEPCIAQRGNAVALAREGDTAVYTSSCVLGFQDPFRLGYI